MLHKQFHIMFVLAVLTGCDAPDQDFRSAGSCMFETIDVAAECDDIHGDDLPRECDSFAVTDLLDLTVSPEMVVLLDGEVLYTPTGQVSLSPTSGNMLVVTLSPVADETIPCDPEIQCCIPREKIIDIKEKPTIIW